MEHYLDNGDKAAFSNFLDPFLWPSMASLVGSFIYGHISGANASIFNPLTVFDTNKHEVLFCCLQFLVEVTVSLNF